MVPAYRRQAVGTGAQSRHALSANRKQKHAKIMVNKYRKISNICKEPVGAQRAVPDTVQYKINIIK